MNPERNKLYAGAAMGLLLAALAGFGVARMTGPSAPTAETEAAADAAQTDTVVITQDGIKTSRIGVAPAAAGGVAGIILASATEGVAAPNVDITTTLGDHLGLNTHEALNLSI